MDTLVEFLKRNGFQVAANDRGIPILEAWRAPCHMRIVKLEPNGSNSAVAHALVKTNDHYFVVFRGRLYEKQPTFQTRIHSIWLDHLHEMGFTNSSSPLVAVISDAVCDAESLPWHEM
jgi:hypothetical protein